MTVTDEVIAGFRAGEEEAIRVMYRTYYGLVYAVARGITADSELAADVVQQTFLKAWRASDRFWAEGSAEPWLYAITRRTAIDALRHERRPTIGGHRGPVELAQDGPSLEQAWTIHEVRMAIDALPPGERQIIRLSHLRGMPYSEIAQHLELPIGTVKSRAFAARRRLAERLDHLREHN